MDNNISNDDEQKFIKIWSFLPKEVKDFFTNIAVSTTLAMNKVEKETFAQDAEAVYTGNKLQQDNSIAKDFLQKMKVGVRDEQYIKYFYEVLEKADTFIDKNDVTKLNEARAKFGMNDGGDNLFEYASTNHSKKITNENVEIVFKNSFTVKNQYEAFMGAPEIREYMLQVNGSGNPYYKIGEYTEYLEIIRTSVSTRQLKFFIPKNFGFNGNDYRFLNDFKDSKYVNFTDKYGKKHQYFIERFDSVETNDLYHIVKFNGNKIEVIW
jgi:hypothetical protein